ncbi:MAG TPA: hypothetical protein VIU11_13025 [Nakamurella sp.]
MTPAAERVSTERDVARRRAEPEAGRAREPGQPRPVRRSTAAMNPRSMNALQRSAGNAAVAGLVRGRSGPSGASGAGPAGASQAPAGGGSSAGAVVTTAGDAAVLPVQRLAPGSAAAGSSSPPVPPAAADPTADPRFIAVTGAVNSAGTQLRRHPPTATEVGKAQAAAKGPPDDKAGQAKAAQADAMAAARPGGFDKAAFVAAVRKAIADAAPKNLDEADKFATSGKADGVKSQVVSQVTAGRDASVKNVKDETGKTPDASAGREKPVTPLAAEPSPAVPPVNGAAAMPGPAPAEQIHFAGGPAQVDQQMADAQVTEKHLEKSNEPQLQDAAAAKKDAEAHSAAAPAAIRAHEATTLGEAKAGAGADASAAMAGMGRDRAGALARVAGAKSDTKSKDEVERARISGEINKIFDKTKADVEAILGGIDGKVTAEFDKGEGAARTAFTARHRADMDRYKDQRYSGVTGAARWTADLFTGLPAEADRIYDVAKAQYESQMTAVISTVAELIGRELDAAKARVQTGRQQIKDYVAAQPAALQKLAGEAAKDVSGKFDQLDADVDAKQQSLVDDLASKYVQARGRMDEEIKAEQEKNKGLVDKAMDAIGGAIDTILKLKALFTGLLARATSAFAKILEDPVAFISNFMSAVKQGFLSFASNILTHLKTGLLGWLFGALASAGIELPDSFDLKGILKLVGSILGLTWTNIKARIAKLAPWAAAAIDVIQSKIEIFTILATQGISGLWNWIKDKLGDLKSMILTPIMDFVKEKIIVAGISWVIGMLNPAGALVKIVQALVGVVQWIMERGAALMDFVGTVIDSISDIAQGGVGGVPAKIEAALGKAVPLVIAFLANLLGLGGISDKIKSILKAVQAPINKALDAVLKGALKLAAPLIKGIKGIGAKVKAKVLGGDDSPEGKQKRLEKGVRSGVAAANRFAGRPVGERVLRPLLNGIRIRYGLGALDPVQQGSRWAVQGAVQRMTLPTSVPTSAPAPASAPVPGTAPGGVPAAPGPAPTPGNPGVGAPGLGRIGTHGSKPPSLRSGPRIHWLESEHVIPFATGKRLWDMVRLAVPGRGGSEDRGQTTIMIYYEAARFKTPDDNNMSGQFEAAVGRANVAERLTRARRAFDASGSRSAKEQITDLLALLMQGLRVAKENAVGRTNAAIARENSMTSEGNPLTHGQRRAAPGSSEPPSPTPTQVASAADRQYDNVVELVHQALSSLDPGL